MRNIESVRNIKNTEVIINNYGLFLYKRNLMQIYNSCVHLKMPRVLVTALDYTEESNQFEILTGSTYKDNLVLIGI